MVNKKIKVIAKIERDAQNYFFVKMLYGFSDSQEELQTVYGIEDEGLIDKLSALSRKVLSRLDIRFIREYGNGIIIYDVPSKYCYHGPGTNYNAPNKIIVGTTPMSITPIINYLINMISTTIEKEGMEEFFVQYKDKIMPMDEFNEFQDKLRIYNTV